jgi:hypothetical protein
LEADLQDHKQLLKKYELEFKETASQKQAMKKQVDEYEMKIKRLIIEFEEESKKHIRELNEVHEQCRLHKGQALELE